MSQLSPQKHIINSHFLKRSVSLLSGLSLLSSGILGTQYLAKANAEELVIPDNQPSSPPVQVTEPLKPVPIQAPKPITQTTPIKSPVVNTVVPVQPPIPKRQVNATQPSRRNNPSTRLVLPQNHSTNMPVLAPQENSVGKNSYIDPTPYNTSPVNPYKPPSSVVITERSTGCQVTAQNGRFVKGQCAVATQPRTTRQRITKPLAPVNLVASKQPRIYRQTQTVVQPRPVRTNTVIHFNAPRINGVKLALAPVPSNQSTDTTIPQYERATRLSPTVTTQGARRTDLLYPLVIPAQISSIFGWRNHPISGSKSMHAGTDLAAPMGTPVLAAYQGEVAVADWVQGYGLMVILRHINGTQESRYAHLSEVFVQPGEQVGQGAVIGRVGSTGYSTGPHLHFEWRHNTDRGSVAVDAGLHLEYALDNLVGRMQLAQTVTGDQTSPSAPLLMKVK